VSVARTLLLAAIRGYKRHVSPRKGFSCAHRVHLGGCSCSTLGLRAVSRYGAWRGLGVLRLRLQECHRVALALRPRPGTVRPAQAGFIDCDVPCDGSCVDASSCAPGDACDACDACEIVSCLDWGDCGCGDWLTSRRAQDVAPRRRRRRGEPVAGPPEPAEDAASAD
jgi:putative component of membrane protein insertase Oxa1/YidC/SpoIIIJ protein YidD